MAKVADLGAVRVRNIVGVLHRGIPAGRPGVCSVIGQALGVRVVEVEGEAVLKPLVESELQRVIRRTACKFPQNHIAQIRMHPGTQCRRE